ncbi:MAG: nucleotidyl transferase AbiEii/AbiGii toxin family protein [Elusimicrobia bacterium]|nr:nucleotidyl transferase AbiEii/AbiGii toxin family protein [Elusimicrobiota bacterium]
MPIRSFELRELFHLTLLRHLGTRLSGRAYAVKGGICLRFFHRSARLSEDMDLDIVSSVRVATLSKAVDSVLEGPALAASLAASGITRLAATRPKQTETTQRWKVSLVLASAETLPTKVEFSRRNDSVRFSTGVPDAELIGRYRMPPFSAQFYDAALMAGQKITALASPARSALRDLYDLHHLLFTAGVKPEALTALVESATVEAAAEKVVGFTFQEFREQVVPYLSAELIDLYRDASAFNRQKEEVERALAGLLR